MKRLALFVIFVAACGTQESGSLLTRGMSAEITASSDGAMTTVTAELFAGTPGQLIFVKLTDGDELTALRGSELQSMIETQLVTIVGYTAIFTGGQDGETFTVDFQRSVDQGAPDSTAILPTPFAIDLPQTTQSRAQAMSIAWSPVSSDPMSFQIDGSCIESVTGDVPGLNASALVVPANTVRKLQGQNIPDTCTATATLHRTRAGALDPAFGKGGSVTAEQVRTATFTTTL
jgi:hypothetical protein